MDEGKKKVSIRNDVLIISILVIIGICVILGYIFFMKRASAELSLLGQENVVLEVGNEYKEEGYVAKISNKDINDKVKVISDLNTNAVGDYKIQYNLKIGYLSVDKTVERQVKIIDTTKPEIKIEGKKKVTAYIGDKFKYPKYTATDNYDGDITDKVLVSDNINFEKVGRYEINYKVIDSNGNTDEQKVTVSVEKKKNPYVVVSIANQTLKYYEYDKLVLTSPVVTGINGKTPRGTFAVEDKETNIILKGADYESFVSYWIGFYRGAFGFHDASWRSSFGGNIYQYAGSHGCVNMPYSKVKQLYNMIDMGTPVYVK